MFPSTQDYQKAIQIKNAGFFKKLFISKEKKLWADDIINWKLMMESRLAEEKAKKKLEESIKSNLKDYQAKPTKRTDDRNNNDYNPNIYPYNQTTDNTALNLVVTAFILDSLSSSSSDSSDSSDSYSSSSYSSSDSYSSSSSSDSSSSSSSD